MATAQQVTSDNEAGRWLYGSWTSETAAADHTITFPEHVAYITVYLDTSGTNPIMLVKHVGQSADTMVTTGSSGIITSPTDATGITVTNYSNGTCSVLVDSNSQVASGVNCWVALTKA